LEYENQVVEVVVDLPPPEFDPVTAHYAAWVGSYSADDYAGIADARRPNLTVMLKFGDGQCHEVAVLDVEWMSGGAIGSFVVNSGSDEVHE
jgi:hypothetical protein